MLLEDRVITTDVLRNQSALAFHEADITLPAGVLEMLEDPAFHVVMPAGRVTGPETDKMLVHVVLDTGDESICVDAMVDDDWFLELPTAHQVLVNVRAVLPGIAQSAIEDLDE